MASSRTRLQVLLLGLVVLGLAWSGIAPHDRLTWLLEVFPVLLGVPVLIATRRRFPLTTLAYVLIAAHCWILMIGGRYTYAEVPAFNWIRDHYHLARNDYDRVGHFAQGLVPAILTREVLLRLRVVLRRGWLFFLVTAVCLAISACYEFVEWGSAVAGGSAADAFLGTQGDVWDTQWDMFTALIGAIVGQVLLGRVHDRQIEAMEGTLLSSELRDPSLRSG